MEKDVEIGIFGGTGIYDSGLLENAEIGRAHVWTPVTL